MSFPKTLRKIREEKGLTQEKLGLKVKLSRVYMSQLESGTRGARMPTVLKLAKALGVPPGDLMK